MSLINDQTVEEGVQIFNSLRKYSHEQIVFCNDNETGLKAIIAIHNTTLGPGLGGTRMYNYMNEEDAIIDVMRLSRGMTYKAAISGLNLGGAKAVIIGDHTKHKSEALFRKFGQFVENLNGKYITAEDVGTTTRDMEYINMETDYVVGLPEVRGGGGDPSPVTAYGTFLGMKAAAKEVYGSENLSSKKILIQGVGKVGMHLAELLSKENAKLLVSDVNEEMLNKAVKDYGAEVVPNGEVYNTNMDIYAPCALGATLNDETVPSLNCAIIAGAANNQLKDEDVHGKMLADRGILYAPDFLINAGGLINVYTEWNGYNRDVALATTEQIYDQARELFKKAKEEQITTNESAIKLAEERIEKIGRIHLTY